MCKKHEQLTAVVAASRIWDHGRKDSHAFCLSPDAYQLGKKQVRELSILGFALRECLAGLSHIATIAYDRDLNYGGSWLRARRVFSTGVPKLYQELQGLHLQLIPKLLKVDLMVDYAGNFRIAEVDGHNKHGLGYSTLGRYFRAAMYPDAAILPGAVKLLADEIHRSACGTDLKLFYADQERFYLPEFEIASHEFRRYGIGCQILPEMETEAWMLQGGTLLDLPFLYHRIDLYTNLVEGYKEGTASFIIPPKPFLGAKGVLALLRNDGRDVGIEALLSSFIRKQSLDLVRLYIPETVLVGKQAERIDAVKDRVSRKRYVLKESISSGMKGTIFSDDPEFEAILARACTANMNWILQEEVENKPHTYSWFENEEGRQPILKTAEDWFLRVTVQYVDYHLADAVVTARRDKAVHGSKDCIMLGTMLA